MILLIGILVSIISDVLRFPARLLLLITGLLLGSINFNREYLFKIDSTYLAVLATFILVIVVFDSSARLRLRESSWNLKHEMKFLKVFLIFSLVGVTFFTAALFFTKTTMISIIFSLVFSAIIIETDSGSLISMLKKFAKEKAGRLVLFLETEANLNSSIVALLPLVIIHFMKNINFSQGEYASILFQRILGFALEIFLSILIGAGVGFMVIKYLEKLYSEQLIPLVLLSASLMSYLLAKAVGGEGFVAVASLGLLFGAKYVKDKYPLDEFGRLLSRFIEIFLFIALGISIRLPFTIDFFINSLFLFVILVVVRLLAVHTTLKEEHFSKEDKLFISLNMPKGIVFGSILLFISLYSSSAIKTILPIGIAFMLYSILVAFISDKYHAKIIDFKSKGSELPLVKDRNILEQILIPKVIKKRKIPKNSRTKSKKNNATLSK